MVLFKLLYITLDFFSKEASAIGIIGGVDGPTTIFLASKFDYSILLPYIVLGICLLIVKKSR